MPSDDRDVVYILSDYTHWLDEAERERNVHIDICVLLLAYPEALHLRSEPGDTGTLVYRPDLPRVVTIYTRLRHLTRAITAQNYFFLSARFIKKGVKTLKQCSGKGVDGAPQGRDC